MENERFVQKISKQILRCPKGISYINSDLEWRLCTGKVFTHSTSASGCPNKHGLVVFPNLCISHVT
jgi:hypothetical protein